QRAGWPAPGSAGDESGCCARSRQGGQGAHRADGRRGHSLAETLSEREPPAADERAPECDAVPESPRRRHDPAGVLVPYQTLCAARGLAPAALAAYAASRLCHTFIESWCGFACRTAAAWPQRSQHDTDLHACGAGAHEIPASAASSTRIALAAFYL